MTQEQFDGLAEIIRGLLEITQRQNRIIDAMAKGLLAATSGNNDLDKAMLQILRELETRKKPEGL